MLQQFPCQRAQASAQRGNGAITGRGAASVQRGAGRILPRCASFAERHAHPFGDLP
jgi:hypothetical protein